jgi:hypothetical protein
MREWFAKDPTNIVHIFSRSKYCYEYLMKSLSVKFNCKVHVTDAQFYSYRYVPSISKFLTTDANSSKVHFCKAPYSAQHMPTHEELPCKHHLRNKPNVLTLIPSVMYFTTSNIIPTELVRCLKDNVIRLCFSTHCSYSELIDFLKCLKPNAIYANVRPNMSLSLANVRASLAFLELPRRQQSGNSVGSSSGYSNIEFKFKRPRKSVLNDPIEPETDKDEQTNDQPERPTITTKECNQD